MVIAVASIASVLLVHLHRLRRARLQVSGTGLSRTDGTPVVAPVYADAAMGESIICSNQPLATAAGLEMMASGGNAVDAAVASLFTLCVVEPMHVGLCGGGVAMVHLADGRLIAVDGIYAAGASAREEIVSPAHPNVEVTSPLYYKHAMATTGAAAVCTPGSLATWCRLLDEHGTMSLAAVLRPAISHAEHGFRVSRYLHKYLREYADTLSTTCAEAAAIFMPDDRPLAVGEVLRQPQLAETLRRVTIHGAAELHAAEGTLAQGVASLPRSLVSMADLATYQPREAPPAVGSYRGWRVISVPSLGASGIYLIAVLQLLECFDVFSLDVVDRVDLLAQALTIVFADRAAFCADGGCDSGSEDATAVQAGSQARLVERLLSRRYASEQAARIRLPRRAAPVSCAKPAATAAQEAAEAAAAAEESTAMHTTHVTAADAHGNVISITQTLNDAFGAALVAPGTGALLNNGMALFEPRAGRPNSVTAGKRPATSHAPTILLHPSSGRPYLALGKIGGMRIWPSVAQVILNVVDDGMGVRAAIDAPLMWTRGGVLELERGYAPEVGVALKTRGYDVKWRDAIGGGGSAVVATEGSRGFEGACCWRADGHAAALTGCEARDVEPHY